MSYKEREEGGTDRQTDRQAGRQADRQTGTQTVRQSATQKGNLARPHSRSPRAVRKPEGPAMHCHLHWGDWSFHLTNEKTKKTVRWVDRDKQINRQTARQGQTRQRKTGGQTDKDRKKDRGYDEDDDVDDEDDNDDNNNKREKGNCFQSLCPACYHTAIVQCEDHV